VLHDRPRHQHHHRADCHNDIHRVSRRDHGLELQDVQFGNPAGEEIGSCLPLITYEMACGSGFINVN
jgi:hypothetical protein